VRLENGQDVRCADAPFGELADVVIDPTTAKVTHVVVQPHDEPDAARLAPIDLVERDDESTVLSLRCTVAEALALEQVQEFAYLRAGEFPVVDPGWDIGVQDLLVSPYYATAGIGNDPEQDYDPHVGGHYHRIPKGNVEIRRASEVFASDGDRIGHVDGFLVDAEGQITHVVLERGHFWGRRDVSVPIGNVETVETDAVKLDLSKDEVSALPQHRVHRWGLERS